MSKQTLLILSFFLFLISYPLISLGTTGEGQALWIAGLISLGLAGIIPPASRAIHDDDSGD
jgi:hypothetical protein